jgi:hypothetical protein
MLRTRNVQPSLWESVLPEVCMRLPAELARVDEWLDDERFCAPFKAHFDPQLGTAQRADADLSAADVPQTPLSARLPDPVCGGGRFDFVAAVLPHRHRRRVPHPHGPAVATEALRSV